MRRLFLLIHGLHYSAHYLDDEILALSKLKAFADDNFNATRMVKKGKHYDNTRDGTEYSNIRKSAEYSNSEIIFDYLIMGDNFI